MNTWGSSAVDRFPLGSRKVDLTSSMSRVNASTPKTAGVINDLDAEETMQKRCGNSGIDWIFALLCSGQD